MGGVDQQQCSSLLESTHKNGPKEDSSKTFTPKNWLRMDEKESVPMFEDIYVEYLRTKETSYCDFLYIKLYI